MRSCGAALALATAFAAALFFAPEASAQVQKKRPGAKETIQSEWRFVRRSNAPTLLYGASADDFQISFSCQPDTGLVRVIAQIGSRGIQPGDGAAIKLANGKRRFEIAGTAFSTAARKDIDIGSATRLDPDLFVLFKGGETLVVEVPGRKRSLPVQNVGPSADAFQKACTATVAGARPVAG